MQTVALVKTNHVVRINEAQDCDKVGSRLRGVKNLGGWAKPMTLLHSKTRVGCLTANTNFIVFFQDLENANKKYVEIVPIYPVLRKIFCFVNASLSC